MTARQEAPQRLGRPPLRPGESLCDHCTAKCCRYFALPLETPTKRKDFDYLRWYLLHGQTAVFVEEGAWYLLVETPCQHLLSDHRCGIYATRPQICRDYSTDDCEFGDDWVYERLFELPEQIEEYAEAVLKRDRGTGVRSPRPALLPIIA